jgi:hypothetical protein
MGGQFLHRRLSVFNRQVGLASSLRSAASAVNWLPARPKAVPRKKATHGIKGSKLWCLVGAEPRWRIQIGNPGFILCTTAGNDCPGVLTRVADLTIRMPSDRL